jgi:hypothetical protein
MSPTCRPHKFDLSNTYEDDDGNECAQQCDFLDEDGLSEAKHILKLIRGALRDEDRFIGHANGTSLVSAAGAVDAFAQFINDHSDFFYDRSYDDEDYALTQLIIKKRMASRQELRSLESIMESVIDDALRLRPQSDVGWVILNRNQVQDLIGDVSKAFMLLSDTLRKTNSPFIRDQQRQMLIALLKSMVAELEGPAIDKRRFSELTDLLKNLAIEAGKKFAGEIVSGALLMAYKFAAQLIEAIGNSSAEVNSVGSLFEGDTFDERDC